jgi:hypothetical protein
LGLLFVRCYACATFEPERTTSMAAQKDCSEG